MAVRCLLTDLDREGVTVTAADALTVAYLTAFAGCAVPGIVRLRRRKQSQDLSVWREWMLIGGIACQLGVMLLTGADWRVRIGPVLSATSIGVLLGHVCWYRRRA